MKKVIIIIISLFLALPLVLKANGNVQISNESLEIMVGESETFEIVPTNSAGIVKIVSSNTKIATVDKRTGWIENDPDIEEDEQSVVVTVTGIKPGSTTIMININAVTFNEEEMIFAKIINVNVVGAPSSYTIQYELNGGILNKLCDDNANPEYAEGDTIVRICNPRKNGYFFNGWTSKTLGPNAKVGDSNDLGSWDGSSTLNSYFKSLVDSGTVTMVANFEKIIPRISDETGLSVKLDVIRGIRLNSNSDNVNLQLGDMYSTKITNISGIRKTNALMATGDKVQIFIDDDLIVEYKVSVKGDIDGNGVISPLDYVKVKNHIMGSKLIVDSEFLDAADMSDDGNISPLDYVKIKNYIMNNK